MDFFQYQNDTLFAENVAVSAIAARFGTPCYIYSRATLERHWHVFNNALGDHPHLICYAVKANSNLAVLNKLAKLGSGFDIVSGGEAARVLAAKGDPKKIIFSGVGKSSEEIEHALSLGIYCFNVESVPELERIQTLAAKQNKIANIALRINPDVDARTHPHISTGLKENKFGIPIAEVPAIYQRAQQLTHLKITGIACHIGSQLTQLAPFLEALKQLLVLHDELQKMNIPIEHLDLGGGLGVRYADETPPTPEEYTSALLQLIKPRRLKIILEPGRAIVANAGILLTRVEYLKHAPHKNFAIVDAGMNDLVRPVLYDAWQAIIPVILRTTAEQTLYDVVGPVCETGDFLGKNRLLAIAPDDLLAIRGAGAYGFSMSSNYNSRPRPAEVLVDDEKMQLIRERESENALFAGELLIP